MKTDPDRWHCSHWKWKVGHMLLFSHLGILGLVIISRWAPSWENLFLPYVNKKGADQHMHLHSLISAFVVRCLDSIISLVSTFAISWLRLASVAEQDGLSLTGPQTLKTGFLVTRLMKNSTYLLIHKIARILVKSILNPDMSHLVTKPTVWLCAQCRLGSAVHLPSLIRVFAVHLMGS